MTSMWMVQNDDGKYLDYLDDQVYRFSSKIFGQAFCKSEAKVMARDYGGHLVEMVPAKPKVPVSREEAEMLRKAGADGYSVGKIIVAFVNNAGLDTVICSDENLLQHEDRLMRAYVNGWTVNKPKRYVLPMEGTDSQPFTISERTVKQYCSIKDGYWDFWPAWDDKDAAEKGHTVTRADIDAAPKWVQVLERVEVTDDEQ